MVGLLTRSPELLMRYGLGKGDVAGGIGTRLPELHRHCAYAVSYSVGYVNPLEGFI